MARSDQERRPTWFPDAQSDIERSLVSVASSALEQARQLGTDRAEVSIAQEQGRSVTVRNGEVETVEHNRDKNIGLTVYFGHRSGTASSTDFSSEAIRSCVQSACNIARYTEEDPCNGLADVELLATEFPDLDLNHPWSVPVDQMIEIATNCETAAMDSDSRISNTEGSTVSSHNGVSMLANSHGFFGLSRGSRHSIGCSMIAGAGEDMHRDYWYDSKRHADDLMLSNAIGLEAARRTVHRLGARKIRTGEYPVIFDSGVSATLISHLVSAIKGSSLYRKASFLLDHKGQRIFPRGLEIVERPHLPRAMGSAVFDHEGVATRPNRIVCDGTLENYLLNSYSARKLGLQTTGNAGGVHNLTVSADAEQSGVPGNLEEMIRDMGRGIVVSELIGFGVNTVTGDYSRGAFGFWVENGEIQYPVQEFTIAGNLKEMFQAITAVGSDVDLRKNIRAGSILIENLTVAGE